MVKEACATRLLQAWLCLLEENVLTLLSMLDVETSEETCQLALSSLFKPIPATELVNKFDLIDDRYCTDLYFRWVLNLLSTIYMYMYNMLQRQYM